jgi:hypothetical protein
MNRRQCHCSGENIMGSSLHNKIQLGRSSVLASKRVQSFLLLTAVVGISLAWFTLRTIK